MKRDKPFVGPVTGHVYDVPNGEKIDPAAEGIGRTHESGSPTASIDGKDVYARIFVRLRTPQETLMCRPIRDGKDFAQRVSIIENWFNSIVRKPNLILCFEAVEITPEEAIAMEKGGEA